MFIIPFCILFKSGLGASSSSIIDTISLSSISSHSPLSLSLPLSLVSNSNQKMSSENHKGLYISTGNDRQIPRSNFKASNQFSRRNLSMRREKSSMPISPSLIVKSPRSIYTIREMEEIEAGTREQEDEKRDKEKNRSKGSTERTKENIKKGKGDKNEKSKTNQSFDDSDFTIEDDDYVIVHSQNFNFENKPKERKEKAKIEMEDDNDSDEERKETIPLSVKSDANLFIPFLLEKSSVSEMEGEREELETEKSKETKGSKGEFSILSTFEKSIKAKNKLKETILKESKKEEKDQEKGNFKNNDMTLKSGLDHYQIANFSNRGPRSAYKKGYSWRRKMNHSNDGLRYFHKKGYYWRPKHND